MKQVIAMHGWSGDSDSWGLWIPPFKSLGWFWQSAERGYGTLPTNQPKWNKEPERSKNPSRALICHSLGQHLLPTKVVVNATHVVLLNSFSSFIPKGRGNRSLRIALKRMQAQLGTNKESRMLNDFLAKASYPATVSSHPKGPIHHGLSWEGRKKLQDDLELLINTSGLPKGLNKQARVLVIEGEQDAILPPPTRACLMIDLKHHLHRPPSHWTLPNSGHTIIESNLIEKVRNWLEECK